MKKEFLLLIIGLCSLSCKTFAASPFTFGDSIALYSTKDSLVDEFIKRDPKAGFKDLFITTTLSSGFSAKNLNPRAVTFVTGYMNAHGRRLNKMKTWGRPYFDLMDGILVKHGLPSELKYLSVIESDLKSSAVSWAGAVGPWQFMPETGRRLGLRINKRGDDRRDFYKSTHAAARYLTELYGLFGDWLLVIAAYNGGPGNVNAAIRKSGSRNFWDLQYYLPEESRNHVKKFIATHYIMEGGGSAATLTKSEASSLMLGSNNTTPADANVSVVELNGGSKYSSVIIADFLQINVVDFNKLNPNFDRLLSTTDADQTVQLRLPADKLLLFQANKMQILEQSMKLMLSLKN